MPLFNRYTFCASSSKYANTNFCSDREQNRRNPQFQEQPSKELHFQHQGKFFPWLTLAPTHIYKTQRAWSSEKLDKRCACSQYMGRCGALINAQGAFAPIVFLYNIYFGRQIDVRAPDCTARDKFRFMRSILISPCTSSAAPPIKMQICLRGRKCKAVERREEIKPTHKRRATLSVCAVRI